MTSTATMLAAAVGVVAFAGDRTLAAFQIATRRLIGRRPPGLQPDRVHVVARDGRALVAARYRPVAHRRGAVVVAGPGEAGEALAERLHGAGYAVLLLDAAAAAATARGRGRQGLLGGVDYLLERGHAEDRIGVALATAGGAWTLLDASAATAQSAWSCVARLDGAVTCLHQRLGA